MSLRKSCLKLSSPLPSPGLTGGRKNVVFDESEGREEVFIADDWDRTPSEPSLKLSYSDLLELKAIQRSLPRANQLPDPYSGKPATNYLRKVPIHLLPLLPDTPSPSPSPTPFLHNGRDITSPPAQQEERTGWASDVQPVTSVSVTRRPEAPSSASYYPPHLAHLRSMKKEEKKMPFAILPLLDNNACPSPPPQQPIVAPAPQPATSSTEPPPFFLLPPGRNRNAQEDQKNAYSLYPPSTSSSTPKPEEEKKKSRNVMWVNGMEIDLDDDDDEPEPVPVPVTDEETETETETDIPSSSDSSAIHTETESSDDESCPSTPCSMKRLPRLSFSSQSSSSSYQSSLLDTPPHNIQLLSLCGEDTNRKEWASVFA